MLITRNLVVWVPWSFLLYFVLLMYHQAADVSWHLRRLSHLDCNLKDTKYSVPTGTGGWFCYWWDKERKPPPPTSNTDLQQCKQLQKEESKVYLIFVNSSGSVARLVTEQVTGLWTVTWLTYESEPSTISLVFQGNPETQLSASFFCVCLRTEIGKPSGWTLEQKFIHQMRDTVP